MSNSFQSIDKAFLTCKTRQDYFDVLSTYTPTSDDYPKSEDALHNLYNFIKLNKRFNVISTNPTLIVISPKILMIAIHYNKQQVVKAIIKSFPKACIDGIPNYWRMLIKVAILRQNVAALLYMIETVEYVRDNAMSVAIAYKSDSFIYILIAEHLNYSPTINDIMNVAKYSDYALIALIPFIDITCHRTIISNLRKLKMYDTIALFDKYSDYKSYDIVSKSRVLADVKIADTPNVNPYDADDDTDDEMPTLEPEVVDEPKSEAESVPIFTKYPQAYVFPKAGYNPTAALGIAITANDVSMIKSIFNNNIIKKTELFKILTNHPDTTIDTIRAVADIM